MKKYEYKCIPISRILGGGERVTEILNEYGQNGWELVCVWMFWHYFRRPVE